MAAPYTLRQGQFLAYIHTYTRLHRQPPSESEMAYFFGVSPPSVHQMVVTLERRGLLQRTRAWPAPCACCCPPRHSPTWTARRRRLLWPPRTLAWRHGSARAAAWSWAAPTMARALDESGVVWQGQESYSGLGELLQDLEASLDTLVAD